jgi:hypothetical protein
MHLGRSPFAMNAPVKLESRTQQKSRPAKGIVDVRMIVSIALLENCILSPSAAAMLF